MAHIQNMQFKKKKKTRYKLHCRKNIGDECIKIKK